MKSAEDNALAQGGERPEQARAEAEEWVRLYGDHLFRHALLRVRQREAAEDLVQEVFLAAWKSRERFAHRASGKTWLFQILRHKIADYFRRLRPELGGNNIEELAGLEESQFEAGILGGAHWGRRVGPRNWSHPGESLERSEFWEAVNHCAAQLPDKTAKAFVMREVDEIESDEVCERLRIKPAHLFVLLHRARLAMRRCLELNWFRRRHMHVPPSG